jgi:hypothetical protein
MAKTRKDKRTRKMRKNRNRKSKRGGTGIGNRMYSAYQSMPSMPSRNNSMKFLGNRYRGATSVALGIASAPAKIASSVARGLSSAPAYVRGISQRLRRPANIRQPVPNVVTRELQPEVATVLETSQPVSETVEVPLTDEERAQIEPLKNALRRAAYCSGQPDEEQCHKDKSMPETVGTFIIEKFNKILKSANKYNKLDLLLLKCQPLGGFGVEDPLVLKMDGSIDNILKRLGKIASVNLIAITEAGDISKEQADASRFTELGNVKCMVDEKNKQGNDVKMIDDNAFIYPKSLVEEVGQNKELFFIEAPGKMTISLHIGDKKQFSNLKYMSSNGIRILNVHLPSSGPENTGISVFLNKYMPKPSQLVDGIPHLIVGDSNITSSKTNKTDRNILMKEFRKSINDLYETQESKYEWGLVMNPTKVHKERKGGFLLNQQVNKSNKAANEADGSFIAFRYLKTIKTQPNWNTFFVNGGAFGKNWELCLAPEPASTNRPAPNATLPISPAPIIPQPGQGTSFGGASISDADGIILPPIREAQQVKFLQFDIPIVDIENCLNTETGKMMDRLFIDHTPVEMSLEAIQMLLEPGELIGTPSWKNVIVLNSGSIINSSKQWDDSITDYVSEIKLHDIKLFNEVVGILIDQGGNNVESIVRKSNTLVEKEKVDVIVNKIDGNIRNYELFDGPTFGKFKIDFDAPYFDKFVKALYDAENKLRSDQGLVTRLPPR